jgi:hypothetical protein
VIGCSYFYSYQIGSCEHSNESGSIKGAKFPKKPRNYLFSEDRGPRNYLIRYRFISDENGSTLPPVIMQYTCL